MASKFQFITELYSRTLTKLTGDYESWTGFLRAACYNYKCPFDEQVLIYAQRPNATAVLELEKWNRQFGRWVNAGATGIAVMDEAHGKGRLKHYFDITDTHATRISRPVPIWSMEPAYTEPVIETLEATFGTLSEKDNLPDAILSASRNAVADNVPDYLRDLLDCRDGSMLEELDMLNAEVTYRRALQSSVAYMLMTRLSLPAAAYILPEDFEGIYSFDTPTTINALGIATSDIAEMGLREISRTVMQARREQNFAKDAQIGYDAVKEQNPTEKERSGDHGSDLQSAGGLSPAEPAAAPRAGDASGQVRGAAEAVHQEASQGAVYESQDQRAAGGTSGGDRDGGGEDGDAAGGADGAERGRDGGTESRRSPALDGADEQPEAQRRGNGAERSDLQLISEEPARAGSDALPALADNRANLYHVAAYHHFENGFDDKLDYPTLEEAEAAAQGYVAGTMEADGFAYDGAAVYDADTNVCLRVYGDYPDEKAQAQAAIYAVEHDREAELPAFLDTYLIEAILLDDGGRKHTRQEIFAYFQTNRDIATRTKFLKSSYNDIWVEVLAGADKVRVGYHAEKDGLLMWEGSYLSRTAESVFSWGVVTEMTESLIERGEYKIKLGLQNATVMAEQMSFFGTEDSAAVYEVPEEQRVGELFPARQVPQEVIDQALYTAGNSYGSAERIAVFYTRQWPEAECIVFLRREFGAENGRGIEYEGKKYAVWFMEDGIHLAQGDSIRAGHCRTTVTWEQASARILELLEAGTYLSAPELEQAQDKVLLEMGDALLMTARDLTQEGRAQGLFPQTLAIHDQRKGYPELDEDMVAFAKSEGGLAALAEEYHAFLSAYEQDRSIMRFRLSEYNTHRIGVVLDGIDLPERSFIAQPDFLRRCKMFITQDEIDQFFLADSVDSQLAVYSFFCYPHTKEEQQKFIKSCFGEYSGGGRDGYDYTRSSKGLTYQREYAGKRYGEVTLTISSVVKEYEKLIAQKRFPGEDAVAKIPQYELRELARTVYFGFSDAPDDVPRPYPKGADYYDAVSVIEEQLADKAKAAEMLEALTVYLEGMDEGDRHYDSGQRAREQLSEYVDGTFSLFNHRHDSGLRQAEQEAPPPEEPTQAAMPPAFNLPRKKERLEADAPLFAGGVNYRITDDALGAAPPSQRYANNVAAIRLLKQLEAENRPATPEEQEVLAKYVGWGGLADCFDPKHSRYEELKGLLSETEYAAARESTLTAFYTPPVVIRSIYAVLEQMGFTQGNILEPSCGVGNFLGMLPESMAESKVYGVELDDVSGRIARQLYPRSSISVRGYEKMDFPDNFFDVAVGNVPFGQFKVQDRRYDRLNLSIHEYFFAKTLDKVRPGGVVTFVTSSYTMDKRSGNVRKYIAQRAELLGAIRLPNDTFKAAAGTEVVSDILFLQKRDRMVDIEPEWVQLGTNDDGITMNRYFLDHPDMVLGEMKMVSGPYGPEPTCVPFPDQPLDTLLANAVQNIHGEITTYERGEELGGEDQSIAADPTVRNFSYTLVNDKLYYREDSRMNPVEVSKTAESRIRGMIGLRDCVRTLLEYQTEDYPDGMIRQQQAKLNDLYDRFTHDYGLINSRGNAIAFDQDSSYFLLCSLEVLDEEGGLKRKADLFTKRTIRSHRPAERVDTAVEALALSIGEKARVDMAYMGQLTGKDEDSLFADLQGVVFLNPDYGEKDGEKYLPADEYLSGNVRRKLAEVRTKAKTEPQYLPNVEALEKVQPVDLTASEISVRLGATWLNPEYIRQFIFETLDTPRRARWDIKVHYSQITGEWRIEGKSKDKSNIKAFNTYGTLRASAYEIIESSLNLKDVRIFDYQYDRDGRRVAVLNKKETAIAQGKQELLKEAFAEWIWKDPERREKICKAYNILFNSNRPREYDGSHINFSGMNPEITLRKHQVNAIAHILYGGNTLLAHVVGAGKTFEMVAAAMESKRLGLCQKSLFVVPNHLTEQWASELLQLYPAANVLVATKKDFETKNRKKFCGRIATGDYDAVIIGHSQFEKIPVSIQRQRAILEQQMDEVIQGIREAKADRAENFTIKQMEKTRKGLQNKLDKLNDQSRKDDVVTFEELGVDRLFIDESHYYKNLFLYTKMRNVSGIAQTEAQKSSDLFMKCRYLDEITGGRGVVFATGTPISNSMVELYTIQRYLQMGALQEQGFQHFDAWAANYGETVTAIELAPEGSGYRPKTRFAKFFNLPELMATFKMVADVQTADMLKLPVPKANFHTEVIHPSELQKKAVAGLAERAERVRARVVDPSTDNMLRITNDGRKLALDMRLLSSLAPDDENSKVSVCARNVYRIWAESTAQRSTQLVFCDLSTPKADGSFNVYDDLRQKLLEMGIPENEIAYIHTANTEQKKKELFAKVRGGEVRILMGSTAKMGAGTNVQDRLIALHDLDCPWRPSDLQQRLGRIVRQGNQNPEVEIFRYVTEGTFDAYLYQLVESKQRFIAQIMTSKAPARAAEDVDETALSYAEIKALATGNPQIIEKCNLDMEVSKLNMLRANHLSQRYALEELVLRKYPAEIKELNERIAGYEQDSTHLAEHPKPAEGIAPMVLGGVIYTERENAGKAIIEACTHMNGAETVSIGSYRGFSMLLSYDGAANEFRMVLKGKLSHTAVLGADAGGNVTRIDNALEKITEHLANARSQLAHTTEQLENARTEMTAPFPKEAELAEKTRRLNELNVLLNLNEQDRPVMADEPDEGDRIRPKNAERER